MKELLNQIIKDRDQSAEKFKEKVAFEVLFEDGEIITLRGILNGMPFLWKTVRWEEP